MYVVAVGGDLPSTNARRLWKESRSSLSGGVFRCVFRGREVGIARGARLDGVAPVTVCFSDA